MNHKNLKYFTQLWKLSEQYMRWSIFLSRYNMTIKYHFKSENSYVNALFWRDQDNSDEKNEWMSHWFFQLLKPISASLFSNKENETEAVLTMAVIMIFTVMMPIFTDECNRIEQLWIFSVYDDKDYIKAWQAIKEGARWFPSELNLKALITECQANNDSTLWFRNWCWTPKSEPLQTALIYDVHTFILTNHVGWHNIYNILACDFFWSGMFDNVCWYIWNCDVCGRTKSWWDMKQRFLKPLPVPDRIWQEILMDFIVALPESKGYSNIMVVMLDCRPYSVPNIV